MLRVVSSSQNAGVCLYRLRLRTWLHLEGRSLKVAYVFDDSPSLQQWKIADCHV